MASTLSNVWYDIGDRVKLSTRVLDLEVDQDEEGPLIEIVTLPDGTTRKGKLTDPDVLIFKMKEPDATTTAYTYGVDAEVVRDSVGVFHVNWTVAQAENHWSRFEASGNVGAAEELGFKARSSKVLP